MENCCHPFNKCGENEGECKFDSDCKDNLKCGNKVCYQPACYKEDPCGKLEGDCNVLSDCEKGLVCGTNNCPKGMNSKTNTPFTTDDNCCYEPKGNYRAKDQNAIYSYCVKEQIQSISFNFSCIKVMYHLDAGKKLRLLASWRRQQFPII